MTHSSNPLAARPNPDHPWRWSASIAMTTVLWAGQTLAAGAGHAGTAAHRAPAAADSASARPAESDAAWRGERLSDLAVRWYRWFEAIPVGAVPHGEPSGANCGIGQAGPVWFLSGPLGRTVVNACTVPAGKAILSPVFNVIDDYPCPATFRFEPAPGQGLEAFLTADIAQYLNLAYTTATLDGVALRVQRVRTPLFAFTAAASNDAGDPCITGSPQLAVSEGFYVLIDPPSRGTHVLQLRSGPSVFGGASDVTVNLKIE